MSGTQPSPDIVRAIITDYGGEGPFYAAWIRKQIDPLVKRRFRELAQNDPRLRADLESLTPRRHASKNLRFALELTNYLTAAPRQGLQEEDSVTALSLASEQEAAYRSRSVVSPREELWRRLREALFQLLAAVDIELPPSMEVSVGGRMLRHLAGHEQVERFADLNRWLETMRARSREHEPPALVRLLRWVAPELFEHDEDGYRHRLSFRLYLRDRLRDWCEREGWQPTGRRYLCLDDAFEALDRTRMGELIRTAAEVPVEAVAEDPVVAREAIAWLHAAP